MNSVGLRQRHPVRDELAAQKLTALYGIPIEDADEDEDVASPVADDEEDEDDDEELGDLVEEDEMKENAPVAYEEDVAMDVDGE